MKSYLQEHFVSYADDCDDMAPEVQELGVEHLRHATTLPFVLITDQEGEWITGSSGGTTADRFLTLLKSAIEPK